MLGAIKGSGKLTTSEKKIRRRGGEGEAHFKKQGAAVNTEDLGEVHRQGRSLSWAIGRAFAHMTKKSTNGG